MSCLDCGRGFHDECEREPCCCTEQTSTDNSTPVDAGTSDHKGARGSSNLRQDVTISAGRKRAAAEYEIDPNLPCDWRGKINCGGGFYPVPGCISGFQTDRHHGPDKTTTNNSPENIHLICKPCHNLWHRRNDPAYGPNDKCPAGINPHEPRWATEDEFLILAARTKNGAA